MKKLIALVFAASFLFTGCASELENKAEALVEKACACGDDAKCKLELVGPVLELTKEIMKAEDEGAAKALAKGKDCK